MFEVQKFHLKLGRFKVLAWITYISFIKKCPNRGINNAF